jgi:hypothetical protein
VNITCSYQIGTSDLQYPLKEVEIQFFYKFCIGDLKEDLDKLQVKLTSNINNITLSGDRQNAISIKDRMQTIFSKIARQLFSLSMQVKFISTGKQHLMKNFSGKQIYFIYGDKVSLSKKAKLIMSGCYRKRSPKSSKL